MNKANYVTGLAGTLKLSPKISVQIHVFNQMYPKVEWSGFLVYRKLSDKDFYGDYLILLDAETQAHTNFDFDTDDEESDTLSDFKMMNESLDNFRIGLVHTHNTMGSFFSGEDENEYHSKTEAYGSYLSLIVNYEGSMVAKYGERAIKSDGVLLLQDGTEIKQPKSEVTVTRLLDVSFDIEVTDIEKTGYSFCTKAIARRKAKNIEKYSIPTYNTYASYYGAVPASYKSLSDKLTLTKPVSDSVSVPHAITYDAANTFYNFAKNHLYLLTNIRRSMVDKLIKCTSLEHQDTLDKLSECMMNEVMFHLTPTTGDKFYEYSEIDFSTMTKKLERLTKEYRNNANNSKDIILLEAYYEMLIDLDKQELYGN